MKKGHCLFYYSALYVRLPRKKKCKTRAKMCETTRQKLTGLLKGVRMHK